MRSLNSYLIPVCISVLVFFACKAAGYDILTSKDQFEGFTKNSMTYNKIPSTVVFGEQTYLYLNAAQVITKEGDIRYHIKLGFAARDWLFIEEGESLLFLIDSTRHAVEADGEANQTDVGSNALVGVQVSEVGYYPVDYELLSAIGQGKTVRVRVIGTHSYLERDLDQENIKRFRDFANSFPPKR